MSSVECATETGPAFIEGQAVRPASDPAARLRSRVFFGFGSAMALGLSLAGWYVGGRILAAEQPSPFNMSTGAAAASTANTSPGPVSTEPTLVAPQPVVAPAPPVPQFFLEVAGLGAKQDARFVKRLRTKGLSALIDSGSDKDPRRILIGPFADHQAIERAERKLQALGVLALERTY